MLYEKIKMGIIKDNIQITINESKKLHQEINEDIEKNEKTFQAFTCILYKETTSYDYKKVLDKLINICNDNNYKYAYIYHDKDIYLSDTFDNEYNLIGRCGEIKKPHYHFICICNKQITRYSITNELESLCNDKAIYNNIRALKPRKINNALLYLIHAEYKDRHKYQYPLSDIVTNITDYINYLYGNLGNDNNLFVCLKEYLRKNKRSISFIEIDDLFYENEIEQNAINKCYSRIRDMINEHNKYYDNLKFLREKNDVELMKKYKSIEKQNDVLNKLTDVFDKITIEGDNSIKEIMVTKTKEKKKK